MFKYVVVWIISSVVTIFVFSGLVVKRCYSHIRLQIRSSGPYPFTFEL